ncbi:hypothetical protein GAYE_SCF01G2053 [Galdieria yellowstonensis]|uniref:Conserved oligomeric Golgi complex subunit 3 C-terminal domain-containing protein n=1 Tax=Galdieria yellowstonensis TaxID=3028027 RepID=A0AAV9I9S5_9RHOD|nr:hypothetical protein GAYE_SCF01G2053 [Galdieria yellowstonensis]
MAKETRQPFQDFSQLQQEWKQLSLEGQKAVEKVQKKLQYNLQQDASSSGETINAPVITKTGKSEEKLVTVEDLNEWLLHIKNMEDFQSWLKVVSEFLDSKGNKPLELKREELQKKRDRCSEMSKILENLKKLLQTLGMEANEATSRLEKFLKDMDSTMEQYGYSTELLSVLSQRLAALDFVESTMQLLNQKKLEPSDSEFWKRLKQVEDILNNAISSDVHLSEADEFLVRLIDLELELFDHIRHYFQLCMNQTCADTLKAYRNDSSDTRNTFSYLNAELNRSSSLYSCFRSAKAKSCISALESRVSHGIGAHDKISTHNSLQVIIQSRIQNAAEKILIECVHIYLKERQKVVEQIFFQSFYEFRKIQNISQMARSSGLILIRLLQMEQELFESYFDSNQTCGKYLSSMLDAFGSYFYYTWRPRIVEEQSLSKLVDVVEIFRSEILPQDKASENIQIAKFCSKKVLELTVADAQERITYLTQVYIRNEIQTYNFSSDDLDRCCFLVPSEENIQKEKLTEKKVTNYREALLPFSCWYPPVERTLKLLAMLYRRMSPEVFSGLAEEAVSSCVNTLIRSSQQLKQFMPKDNSSEEHSMLFLMSQLWVLREQIQPFNADFSYQERFLNLSELRNSMMRMIWRSRSNNEAFAQDPHRQIIYDSKRSLEEELKKACENYIMFVCNVYLEPLLSLLSEMNSLTTNTQIPKVNEEETSYAVSPGQAERCRSVKPESIKNTWLSVWSLLEQKLPQHIQLFKRYIRSCQCQEQILSSVCANTSSSCMELLTMLQTSYTLEEREQIAIDGLSIQQLVSRLKEIAGLGNINEESQGDL